MVPIDPKSGEQIDICAIELASLKPGSNETIQPQKVSGRNAMDCHGAQSEAQLLHCPEMLKRRQLRENAFSWKENNRLFKGDQYVLGIQPRKNA